MTASAEKLASSPVLPGNITKFIAILMRAVNTARLYAPTHTLFKQQARQLFKLLTATLDKADLLFLGCARDSLFLEGIFYPAKDVHVRKFLKLFHSLGVSQVIFERDVADRELSSFLVLLAGARQGEGEELMNALIRENIRRVRLGLLDYSIFSTVAAMAGGIAQDTEDQAIWQQLILRPSAGAFQLSPDKSKQFLQLARDADRLKMFLLKMDTDMVENRKCASASQRGAVLGTFIQNLGAALEGAVPKEREHYARRVAAVLDTLETKLKVQVLGALPPEDPETEKTGTLQQIIEGMPDADLAILLVEALETAGAASPGFNNIYRRAIRRYRDAALLLGLIRKETERAAQKGRSGFLSHCQHLEQILIQRQEIDQLNRRYQDEIRDLATSIQLQAPRVEEDELTRLKETLSPENLGIARAELIIDLLRQPHGRRDATFLPPLAERLGETLGRLFSRGEYPVLGNYLRRLFMALEGHPQENLLTKILSAQFSARDIQTILEHFMEKCRTYEPVETAVIHAVCRLYPRKSAGVLLDIITQAPDEQSPQVRWILTTLSALGPSINLSLERRITRAPDQALPLLLDLAGRSGDRNMARCVAQFLEHQNPQIRLKAVVTLGRLKAESAVPRLGEMALQRSWIRTRKTRVVQEAAIKALGAIGTKDAKALLKQVITRGPADLGALCREFL